jgi:hypothetical protein
MPAIVRCKLCGKDHAYRDDIERLDCEECGAPLKMDNTRMILTPRKTEQADPIEFM